MGGGQTGQQERGTVVRRMMETSAVQHSPLTYTRITTTADMLKREEELHCDSGGGALHGAKFFSIIFRIFDNTQIFKHIFRKFSINSV